MATTEMKRKQEQTQHIINYLNGVSSARVEAIAKIVFNAESCYYAERVVKPLLESMFLCGLVDKADENHYSTCTWIKE